MLCVSFVYLGRLPRMGYKYGSILVSNRLLHYSASFEILQAKVKCHISVGPARPVPRALNNHYSGCGGPINFIFHVFYLGLLSEHLGQLS